MKFLKEKDGIYLFIDSDKKRHYVGANSQAEALAILNNRVEPTEMERTKGGLLRQVRELVQEKLEKSDWKVLRHIEQLALVKAGRLDSTDLTNEEYLDFIEKKQRLRNKSNVLEKQIAAKTDLQDLKRMKIDYDKE